MKNLFFALVFVTIGKVLIASDCNLQLNFSGKNNIWKTLNYTVSNGVIYVDVDSDMDSIKFQVAKNSECNTIFEINGYSLNEGFVDLTKKGTEIKVNSSGGLHKILVVGPNNSDWYKIFVRVTKPTHVSNILNSSNLSIYPNPATNNFFVENATQVETIKIHDITGAVVLIVENTFRKDVLDIDIAKLPAGQYFIAFHNDKIKVTKKIVKL
jgi:hypothetical protein